jgi:triosephosphate isomerase
VGETAAERDAGQALGVVLAQVMESLPDAVGEAAFCLAYEPVWAIGTGRTPTLAEIEDMHGAIRAAVYARWGGAGFLPPVLYGGSVKAENAAQILALAGVGGALVGGASLTAAQFLPIVRAA